MPKLNERGIVHFLIPVILLIGLILAVYLVTSNDSLNFRSKASNPPIVFKNLDGSALPTKDDIPQSTSFKVRIELTSTLGPARSGESPRGAEEVKGIESVSLTLGGIRAAYGSKRGDNKFNADYDLNNDGHINLWDFSLLTTKLRQQTTRPTPTTGTNNTNIITREQPVTSDTQSPVNEPKTSADEATPVSTVGYRLAEEVTTLENARFLVYTQDPMIIEYEFKTSGGSPREPDSNSSSSYGRKFIWVDFKDSTGKTDRRSAPIEFIAAETPTATPPAETDSSICDINNDGQISHDDRLYWSRCIRGSLSSCQKLDFDTNNIVDPNDLNIFNTSCPSIKATFSVTFPTIDLASPPPTKTNPSPTPTLQDGVDTSSPKGFSVRRPKECSTITGFACDPDFRSGPVNIDFWDYSTSPPTYLGMTNTNQHWDAVSDKYCGDTSGTEHNYGYSFTIPASIKDGKTHDIKAFAINVNSIGSRVDSNTTNPNLHTLLNIAKDSDMKIICTSAGSPL